MKDNIANNHYWIVMSPDGPEIDTFALSKVDCLLFFQDCCTEGHLHYDSWKQARREGCRCIKVRLIEGWDE